MKKTLRLSESELIKVINRILTESQDDYDTNQWDEVVNYVKVNGVSYYTFSRGIRGDESLGIILTAPENPTMTRQILPSGKFMDLKNQWLWRSGTWTWKAPNNLNFINDPSPKNYSELPKVQPRTQNDRNVKECLRMKGFSASSDGKYDVQMTKTLNNTEVTVISTDDPKTFKVSVVYPDKQTFSQSINVSKLYSQEKIITNPNIPNDNAYFNSGGVPPPKGSSSTLPLFNCILFYDKISGFVNSKITDPKKKWN